MQTEFKTGFWLIADMERGMKNLTLFDLCGYTLGSSVKNAWDFLHGGCLKFALVLHRMFGYEIRIVWNAPFENRTENIWESSAIVDWDRPAAFWDHLVHGYCAADIGGRTAYIDVRGITTERRPFFDAFAEYFHPDPFEETMIPPASLEEFLRTGESVEETFFLAKKLIDERKKDYTLFSS